MDGGRTHPWVMAVLGAAVVFLVLGTHARVGGWNDSSRLAMVEAIVEHGRLWVDGTAMGRITGDVAKIDGHFYSDKPPALALLAVPVYAAQVAFGHTFGNARASTYYWTTLLTVGVVTFFGLLALERFLRHIAVDGRWRAATILAVAFGTLNTAYSVTFSNHAPSAVALLVGFLSLWRWRRFDGGLWGVACGGILLGLAALTDHGAAFYLPAFVAYLGSAERPGRAAATLVFTAVTATAFVAYGAYAYALSGSPLPLPLQPRLFDYPGSYFAQQGRLSGSSFPHGSLHELASYVWLCSFGQRGLFSHTPLLLFVVVGMARLARDRHYPWRGEVAAVAIPTGVLVAYYLLTSSNPGGNAYGVRWFCLFIPLTYIFMAHGFDRLRRGWSRALFWIAYALSIPLALIGALDPWLDPTPYGSGFSWVIVLRSRGWL